MNLENKVKIILILTMLIFGTIGLFVKFIPLSAGIIASSRGILGGVFIFILLLIKKGKIDKKAIKNNFKNLLLCGFLIGANWIFLFEGFKYSKISLVIVLYYLCPIFLIIWSSIFLKEKINIKKKICVFTSLIGVILISGVLNSTLKDVSQIKGVVYGILAGLMYSFVILCNKKIKEVKSLESTMMQLIIAGAFVLPHTIFSEDLGKIQINFSIILMLLIVCLIHTALAYTLYFNSIKVLKLEKVAIFSYLDPVFALFMANIFLKEKLKVIEIIGVILILASAYISEKK